MSNRIDVKSLWMDHEGGTKFYQIFEFIPTGGKAITLTHWGKTAGVSKWARPVQGGETLIKMGRQLMAKSAEKGKRGYSMYDTRNAVWKKDDNWFVQTFGATLAWELNNAMFGADAAKITPSPEPDTVIIPGAREPIEERPASWGTW